MTDCSVVGVTAAFSGGPLNNQTNPTTPATPSAPKVTPPGTEHNIQTNPIKPMLMEFPGGIAFWKFLILLPGKRNQLVKI